MPTERPQDFADLLRLVATVQAAAPGEPVRQAIRAALLAKLTGYVERPELSRRHQPAA